MSAFNEASLHPWCGDCDKGQYHSQTARYFLLYILILLESSGILSKYLNLSPLDKYPDKL